MRRARYRSPVHILLEEAQSIELLLDELAPQPADVQEYWDVSLQLIDLVRSIEELAETSDISLMDERYRTSRTKLTFLESRIVELSGQEDG